MSCSRLRNSGPQSHRQPSAQRAWKVSPDRSVSAGSARLISLNEGIEGYAHVQAITQGSVSGLPLLRAPYGPFTDQTTLKGSWSRADRGFRTLGLATWAGGTKSGLSQKSPVGNEKNPETIPTGILPKSHAVITVQRAVSLVSHVSEPSSAVLFRGGVMLM